MVHYIESAKPVERSLCARFFWHETMDTFTHDWRLVSCGECRRLGVEQQLPDADRRVRERRNKPGGTL